MDPLPNPRQLRYFLAVVDHGGVTSASVALHVSQPSLSASIKRLEEDLGVALFRKSGRRLVLTAEGEALVDPAREAVRLLEGLRVGVHDAESGRRNRPITVAAMPSQAIEPLGSGISRCRRGNGSFPRVTVRSALTAGAVIDLVAAGVVDGGLIASSRRFRRADVDLDWIGRQHFVVVTHPDDPIARFETAAVEELRDRAVIVAPPATETRGFADRLAEEGVGFVPVVESDYRSVVLAYVHHRIGVALVVDSWAQLARAAGLSVVGLDPGGHVDVGWVSRREAHPAAVEALHAALRAAAK